MRRPFDAEGARLTRPPPWWAIACAGVASALRLWNGMLPGDEGVPLVAGGLWVIAVAVMLLQVRDRWIAVRIFERPPPSEARQPIRWVMLTALICTFAIAGPTDVGHRIAFQVSRSRLDALAARVIATGSAAPDQEVGLYPAHGIRRTGYGINFRIAGRYECGLDYTTNGAPGPHGGTALGGGWYEFEGF